MSIVLDTTPGDAITLDELIEHLTTSVDLQDEDALAETGTLLAALCENRRLIVDRLNYELEDFDGFEARHQAYNAQSLSLAATPKFSIRCNVWPRAGRYPSEPDPSRNFFSYGLVHDHNFSLLTAGYEGPGYRTDVYTYDHGVVRGEIGEEVDLHYLETVHLSRGRVALYRKNRHVHVQHPAESLSLSINVLPVPAERTLQYCFDSVHSGVINQVIEDLDPRASLVEMAGLLGDDETLDRLRRMARADRIPTLGRTLRSSAEALADRLASV